MTVRNVEEGYRKAFASDLPCLTMEMALQFLYKATLFSSSEMRGVKTMRSSRESYGDDAIGYVRVRRDKSLCSVLASITPEHKIRKKGYKVQTVVDETNNTVVSSVCFACVACQGGCKHAVAFLFWLHRRSEDKSPTEELCYWKKSALSKVGTEIQCIKAKELSVRKKKVQKQQNIKTNFLQQLRQYADSNVTKPISILIHTTSGTDCGNLQVDLRLNRYLKNLNFGEMPSAADFIECLGEASLRDWNRVTKITEGQSTNPKWFKFRFGRVTGSTCYASAQSHTFDGSLREQLLSCRTFKGNNATRRGLSLEPFVLDVLSKSMNINIQKGLGLHLRQDYPLFGASPDGISIDGKCVIEVKCPTKEENIASYIKDGAICLAYRVQLQMTMFCCNVKNGIFVVASPKFETNCEIVTIYDTLDEHFLMPYLDRAICFWKDTVFPELVKYR